MKVSAQIFLIIFFVLSVIVILFSATLKFEVLNYNFWTTSFSKHDVYTELSQVVKSAVDTQIGKGGGNRKDISVLTDLITPQNTTDFVNKNLFNLLGFLNGNSEELEVYIPVDKVPGGLLPKSIADIDQQMTISELSTRFNIVGLENLPLKNMSLVGLYDYYLLMGSTFLAVLFLILIMLLIESGQRFIAPGIAFVVSGGLMLFLTQWGLKLAGNMSQSLTATSSINKVVAVTVLPPIITDILNTWIYVGIGLIVVGIIFFFVKTKSPIEKIPLN